MTAASSSHAAERVDCARDGLRIARRVGHQRLRAQRRQRARQLARRAVRQVAALRQRLRQLLKSVQRAGRASAPEAGGATRRKQREQPESRACWWLSMSAVLTTTSRGLAARSASKMLPAPAQHRQRKRCARGDDASRRACVADHQRCATHELVQRGREAKIAVPQRVSARQHRSAGAEACSSVQHGRKRSAGHAPHDEGV